MNPSRLHFFGLLAGLALATQGGRTIKELRNARMVVVQINPLYSSSTSCEGNNDTTTLEKTITATVDATIAMK